jgi:hypothetical protein
MKSKIFPILMVIVFLMSSCASTTYYQLYKTTPSEQISVAENFLVFEDSNCKVLYNLWADEGNMGFVFYNKTDENIYLNMEESFFILNEIAYNYFKDRIYTSSKSTAASTSSSALASKSYTGYNYANLLQTNRVSASQSLGIAASAGYSVSMNEEKVICIPTKAAKVVDEYQINQSLYRDCELFKYPTDKQVKTKKFSKSESPMVFSNRLVYYMGNSGNPINIENEFYVSEITNYPASMMTEKLYEEYCGQKSAYQKSFLKYVSPDKFYLKYTKSMDEWKH